MFQCGAGYENITAFGKDCAKFRVRYCFLSVTDFCFLVPSYCMLTIFQFLLLYR